MLIFLIGMHHIQVAITRNHLGTLYAAQGKEYFIQAEKQFLLALEIKEKTFGKVSMETGNRIIDDYHPYYI